MSEEYLLIVRLKDASDQDLREVFSAFNGIEGEAEYVVVPDEFRRKTLALMMEIT